MKNTELLKSLIKLESKGIQFSGRAINGGFYHLSASDAIEYLIDRDLFEAKLLGVSIKEIKAYNEYLADYCRCQAITKSGKRCKNRDQLYHIHMDSINDFIRNGCKSLCVKHQDHKL